MVPRIAMLYPLFNFGTKRFIYCYLTLMILLLIRLHTNYFKNYNVRPTIQFNISHLFAHNQLVKQFFLIH